MSAKVGFGLLVIAASVAVGTAAQPLVEISLLVSVAITGIAARAVLRPPPHVSAASAEALTAARAIVARHGEDSLAPFIIRPDKSFVFADGAVAAYRVVGETVVVSGDPVGPDAAVPAALARLREVTRSRGLRTVIYGASPRHVDVYRGLGLRAICVGEEAVVDPARFTLEGRAVRKLRQSVTRIGRRGWTVVALRGRELDAPVRAELDAVDAQWRSAHERIVGFAMSMGKFDPEVQPNDLFLMARSPEGELRAVMRFVAHRGKLSLDTMRRVGETPNGLNEALVCRALEIARAEGVSEVSLNYAGLGHLFRRGPSGNLMVRALTRWVLRQLSQHFQMERLVRFNEKFAPQWRPRYLVYESRVQLPRSVYRVLQAEGYVEGPSLPVLTAAGNLVRRRVDGLMSLIGPVAWKATR
jgi:lysyl-tRNA synthetase, class II